MGVAAVTTTLLSAVKSMLVPRATPVRLTRLVFVVIRRLFILRSARGRTYEQRDRSMALYAPLSLLSLAGTWLGIVLFAYTAIFWAAGVDPLWEAFRESGSSLLTLGFAVPPDRLTTVLAFSEAALGLSLLALLITFLPSVYATFSRREAAVARLEVRAGSPPSAVEMIERFARIEWLSRLPEIWEQWEVWFVELEETHTSLPALVFFRSPQPERSWVTAAGAVLDGASFVASTFPNRHPEAEVCVRGGTIALRRIADYFEIPYDPDPKRGDPISVTRGEYEEMCVRLAREGVELEPDREQAWMDFNGWRVNYDTVLLALASLTMAPEAPWSSDRAPRFRSPPLTVVGRRRRARERERMTS